MAWASLAVAVLHTLLLRALAWTLTDNEAPVTPPATVSIRSVSTAPESAVPPPGGRPKTLPRKGAAVPSAPKKPAAKPAVTDEAAVNDLPAEQSAASAPVAPVSAAELSPAVVVVQEPASASTDTALNVSVSGTPASAAAVIDIPVYPTHLPPPTTLRYEMHRGAVQGQGELRWHREGEHYEAQLEGRVAGVVVLRWVSAGGLDGAGVAPLRFTDQRGLRVASAANFQREAGKISFSGSTAEYPLPPGAQDRLSWMIQLAGIAQASEVRRVPGSRITLFVAGARGDADAWSFSVTGTEPVDTPGGVVSALHLLREPRKLYDTRVDVWLDPQHHFLPVRALLAPSPTGAALELIRVE